LPRLFTPDATRSRRASRQSRLKGRAGALARLARAYPDVFEDALRAAISKAKERAA
jgi:hypothetical protein